jgi:hypothetical protein
MNAAPIEILMLVDAVDHDGRPVRITLGVPCPVAEVGPLPLAGDFVLGNGDRATYFGHDRTAFLPEASLSLVSGMVRSNVPDYLRLAEVIPVPTTTADADAVPGRDREALGYARYGESDGWLPVDRTVLDEAARRMRTLFDRNVVASGGDILVKVPFPIWIGSGRGRSITLGIHPRGGYMLDGTTEFAAGRMETARRYVEGNAPLEGAERTEVRGEVLHLDQTYETRNDRVLTAVRAGRFVSDKLRHALPGMGRPMVAAWHLAAHAGHADAVGRPWDVEATMRGVADLIAYGDDRANGCTGLADSAVWKAHRRRILDVELAEVAADRPGNAPAAA